MLAESESALRSAQIYVGYNKGSFVPPSIEHDINLVCKCGTCYVTNAIYLLDRTDGRSFCPHCGWLVIDLLEVSLTGQGE